MQLPCALAPEPAGSGIETDVGQVYAPQAFPISDAEYDYLREHGFDEWEKLMIASEVDYTDMGRASAV